MALFRGKGQFDLLLEPYKEHINMLKEHIEKLQKENKLLLEALISVKSPDAYREMKADEAAFSNLDAEAPEQRQRREIEANTHRRWLESLEGPTFVNFDEFESYLRSKNPPTANDMSPGPIHPGNEES